MTRSKRICRVPVGGFLAALAVTGVVTATSGPHLATPPQVSMFSNSTTAEVGRTRMIAFRVGTNGADVMAEGDRTSADAADYEPVCAVSDESVLSIERTARALAGEAIGFVRVRGLREGTAVLSIGGATMEVRVVPARSEAAGLPPGSVRIVNPADGAVAWGHLSVGVELDSEDGEPGPAAQLVLPDGTRLDPIVATGPERGPTRRLVFVVDLDSMKDGPLELRVEGTNGKPDSVRIMKRSPGVTGITQGEAEDRREFDRPERFQDSRATVGRDSGASGGRCFMNASSIPAFCFPVDVPAAGLYQVVLVARGTLAGGAFPTVGIVVDNAEAASTNGRIIAESWQRVTIGVPIQMPAGRHVLTPYFENDFYAPNLADRNLAIDRIEVARVGDVSGEGDRAASMMAGGTMSMDTMTSMASMMSADSAAPNSHENSGWLRPGRAPLRIAFARPINGHQIIGETDIEGALWWADRDRENGHFEPPMVDMIVNGERVFESRTAGPYFILDPGRLKVGANTLCLEARLDNGITARSPEQTVFWNGAPAPPPRRFVRIPVHDAGWDDATRASRRAGGWPREVRAAALTSNGRATLKLPEDLVGRFNLLVECRGEHFDGPPIAKVTLETGGAPTVVKELETPEWWGLHEAGEIELVRGPKTIAVAFENDRYEKDRGDRNFYLQGVTLVERSAAPDTEAPDVELLYPSQSQAVFMADALVARVADGVGVTALEARLDGLATGAWTDCGRRSGLIVLPLALRAVEPGEHSLSVRAYDAAGNVGFSQDVPLRVLQQEPAEPGPFRRAVHLLNRFGYGVEDGELAVLLTAGEEAWLRERLTAQGEAAGDAAAISLAWTRYLSPYAYDCAYRAVEQLCLTPNPVRARFVMWAENHFSTWVRKTEGARKWSEHAAFWVRGAAPFQDLLLCSATSPAMLEYLDQDNSFAGALNENYAREIMELHTLGVHGGYSQADVTSLARLLTGWTAPVEGDGAGPGYPNSACARFDPTLSDGAPLRVVGVAFDQSTPVQRYGRARIALETLAAHPSTARFIATKLAEQFSTVPADEALVGELESVFARTGGDTAAMLTAIAAHPAFWRSERQRIAKPLDYALHLSRATATDQPWLIGDFLARCGNGMFDRPTPDGYPEEDSAYTDSNLMVQRWRLAQDLEWAISGLMVGPLRWGDEPATPEWGQKVIDLYSIRLNGRVLGEESNRAALGLIDPAKSRDDNAVALATLIAQLPESNLR